MKKPVEIDFDTYEVTVNDLSRIPERERWLFEPENREILEKVMKGLKDVEFYSLDEEKKKLAQSKLIDRDSFIKYLEED